MPMRIPKVAFRMSHMSTQDAALAVPIPTIQFGPFTPFTQAIPAGAWAVRARQTELKGLGPAITIVRHGLYFVVPPKDRILDKAT